MHTLATSNYDNQYLYFIPTPPNPESTNENGTVQCLRLPITVIAKYIVFDEGHNNVNQTPSSVQVSKAESSKQTSSSTSFLTEHIQTFKITRNEISSYFNSNTILSPRSLVNSTIDVYVDNGEPRILSMPLTLTPSLEGSTSRIEVFDKFETAVVLSVFDNGYDQILLLPSSTSSNKGSMKDMDMDVIESESNEQLFVKMLMDSCVFNGKYYYIIREPSPTQSINSNEENENETDNVNDNDEDEESNNEIIKQLTTQITNRYNLEVTRKRLKDDVVKSKIKSLSDAKVVLFRFCNTIRDTDTDTDSDEKKTECACICIFNVIEMIVTPTLPPSRLYTLNETRVNVTLHLSPTTNNNNNNNDNGMNYGEFKDVSFTLSTQKHGCYVKSYSPLLQNLRRDGDDDGGSFVVNLVCILFTTDDVSNSNAMMKKRKNYGNDHDKVKEDEDGFTFDIDIHYTRKGKDKDGAINSKVGYTFVSFALPLALSKQVKTIHYRPNIMSSSSSSSSSKMANLKVYTPFPVLEILTVPNLNMKMKMKNSNSLKSILFLSKNDNTNIDNAFSLDRIHSNSLLDVTLFNGNSSGSGSGVDDEMEMFNSRLCISVDSAIKRINLLNRIIALLNANGIQFHINTNSNNNNNGYLRLLQHIKSEVKLYINNSNLSEEMINLDVLKEWNETCRVGDVIRGLELL